MAILDLAVGGRELAGNIDTDIISRMSAADDTDCAEYRAIQWAVHHYSQLAPRELVARFQPTANTHQYLISNFITGFNPKQYNISKVIWPGDDDNVKFDIGLFHQNEYDKNDWSIFRSPADNGYYLRFLNSTEPWPTADNNYVWVYYTAPHVVSDVSDTITSDAPGDVYAVHYLIASRLLNIAAAYFTQQSDPTMSVTAIDNENKSTAYNRRAQDAYKKFEEHMELSGSRLETVFVDWDSHGPYGGDMFWTEYWKT